MSEKKSDGAKVASRKTAFDTPLFERMSTREMFIWLQRIYQSKRQVFQESVSLRSGRFFRDFSRIARFMDLGDSIGEIDIFTFSRPALLIDRSGL